MGARAEALRNPFQDDLRYTLIQVIEGMAESGFYENAKSDIKLIPESDRLRMYLVVAGIQGEKKDLEESESNLSRSDSVGTKAKPTS